jgi:hypothetical protein
MQLLRPWLVDNAGHVVDRFGLSYLCVGGGRFLVLEITSRRI